LHKACGVNGGNEEVVGVLLAAGADVNLVTNSSYKWTAFHCAAANNAGLGVVTQLVQAGVDTNGIISTSINAVDYSGDTALHYIAQCGDGLWPGGDNERIGMAHYLLQHGAQPSLIIKDKVNTHTHTHTHTHMHIHTFTLNLHN